MSCTKTCRGSSIEPCGTPQPNSPAPPRWTHGFVSCCQRHTEQDSQLQTQLPVRPVQTMNHSTKTWWTTSVWTAFDWSREKINLRVKLRSWLTNYWRYLLTCGTIYTDQCASHGICVCVCLCVCVCVCVCLWSVGFQQQHQKRQHRHDFSSKTYSAAAKLTHTGDSLVRFPLTSILWTHTHTHTHTELVDSLVRVV